MAVKSNPISPVNDGFFAKGADLSLLKRNLDWGYSYRVNNIPKDPIQIFSNAGFNYARLRLFHTPSMQGAQVNDLTYTLSLGRQLVKAGFKLLLNLHYSDTWADPGKQTIPRQWERVQPQAVNLPQPWEIIQPLVETIPHR